MAPAFLPAAAALLVSSLSLFPARAYAQAQSPMTVDLLLPDFDDQTIEASVVGVAPTATTYFLACPSGEDSDECGLGPGFTLTAGPSTLALHMVETLVTTVDGTTTFGGYTVDANCAISGDTATCTDQVVSSYGADGTTITATSTARTEIVTGLSSYMVPVTVTAGAEKLSSAGGGGPIATESGSGSGSSVRPTETVGSAPLGSAATTGSGSGSGSSSSGAGTSPTKPATGAAPMITQQAVLAGVAAIVGGAMML